jgi:hypothetical protein
MNDNKVSGQCICATAQTYTPMIRAVMRMLGIVYNDGLLHLLYANHPSVDKTQSEAFDPLVAMGWIHMVFVLVLMNIHEI